MRRFYSLLLSGLVIACLFAGQAYAGMETLAGTGEAFYSGPFVAQARDAHLNKPSSIAFAPNDDAIVTDRINDVVWRIDHKTHSMTKIAGIGPYTNETLSKITAAMASIDTLSEEEREAIGVLYESRLEPGFNGHDFDDANNAQLSNPDGVAVDSDGNIFIADTWNHVIRRIDHITKKMTTIAGTGEAGFNGHDVSNAREALLNGPHALAIDKNGDLIFVEYRNNILRRITRNHDGSYGKITTIAGTGEPGFNGHNYDDARDAQLGTLAGLAVASNRDIFMVDDGNKIVRLIDAKTNAISTIAGRHPTDTTQPIPNSATSHQFTDSQTLQGIAVRSNGDIVIAEATQIWLIDHLTNTIKPIAGTGESGFNGHDHQHAIQAQLDGASPSNLAIRKDGTIAITDTNNNLIRLLTIEE